MSKSIILLSGGLDSIVALAYCLKHTDYNIEIALTFDYGQKAFKSEAWASKKVCEYYNIQHKIIRLDWLEEITKSGLVNSDIEISKKNNSIENLWVPNRNGLFLNIAACFCDSFGYKHIIYGANKEESLLFSDNTEEFRAQLTQGFKTSTMIQPTVVAPLINYTKDDIVKIAIRESVPLEFVRSCYSSADKHCGECDSCRFLKRALKANNCEKYLGMLFNNHEN